MGFRKDAWATCWSVEPKSDTLTVVRISISRKNKQSDDYIQDFSGFVSFVGTASAKKAANLKEKDRIKLGDVEVTTKYNEENGVTYTNFKCYNFEVPENTSQQNEHDNGEPLPGVDEGINEDKRLPF